MSKTKRAHVILGTLTVAVPFNPGDLKSAVQAEAEIRDIAKTCDSPIRDMRLVSVQTRMAKLPLPSPPPAAPVTSQPLPDMPAIPAELRRT